MKPSIKGMLYITKINPGNSWEERFLYTFYFIRKFYVEGTGSKLWDHLIYLSTNSKI